MSTGRRICRLAAAIALAATALVVPLATVVDRAAPKPFDVDLSGVQVLS